jgi:hypothetical protein
MGRSLRDQLLRQGWLGKLSVTPPSAEAKGKACLLSEILVWLSIFKIFPVSSRGIHARHGTLIEAGVRT